MTLKDPVCGAELNASRKPAVFLNYSGARYAFCGTDCRNEFLEEPLKYLLECECHTASPLNSLAEMAIEDITAGGGRNLDNG